MIWRMKFTNDRQITVLLLKAAIRSKEIRMNAVLFQKFRRGCPSFCMLTYQEFGTELVMIENTGINPLPANVENMVSSENANKGEMIFNSAFKGLNN